MIQWGDGKTIEDPYSDAIYHVMARGNGRQDIVEDDADRGRLVACLEPRGQAVGMVAVCLRPLDQSPPPGPQNTSRLRAQTDLEFFVE